MSGAEAKNLEAISKAIDQHNTNCPFPAAEVRMNPFEAERLGWDEIRGLPVVPDPEVGTGRFKIVCSRDIEGEGIEEAEALGIPIEVAVPKERQTTPSGGQLSTLTVPGRFNGPRDSGNGGYSCGLFARLIDGPAEVSLRAPVPLDTELGGELRDGGVDVLADGEMIARVEPAEELDLEVPETVNLDEAREGSKLYRGVEDGPFSHCFVCGLSRPDAYGVFAGEVEGKRVVASPWTPPAETAGYDDSVDEEFVWAVLDCPTYFAAYYGEELEMSVLARQQVQIDAPVPVGEEHVVMAWPISTDGRKRLTGCALLSSEGETLARGQVLMVAIPG